MKTKNVVLGCLMLGLSFTSVFAGDKGGNGGDGIVCGDSVVMLDYMEMNKRNLTLDLPGSTIREKVEAVIDRVRKLDRFRAVTLGEYAGELISDIEKREAGETSFKNIDFTTDVLSDVPDSLETTIPRGCVKEQLVTQKEAIFPEDKRYTISEILFDKMDVDQKTLMVLHESWYRMFLSDKAVDSRFARYMNGIFASKDKHKMNLLEYFELLDFSNKLGGFQTSYYIMIQGNLFKADEFNSIQKPGTSGRNVSDFEFKKAKFDANGNLTLDLSGRADSLILSGNKINNIWAKKITLDKDNNILSVEVETIGPFQFGSDDLNIRIKNVQLKKIGFLVPTIKFDSAGNIQEFDGYAQEIDQDNKVVKKANFFSKSYYHVNLKVQGDQVYYDIR